MTDVPPVADGQYHPLDPRVIPLERLTGAIGAAVVAGVLLVALVIVSLAGRIPLLGLPFVFGLWMAVVVLLGVHAWRWPAIAYRHASYRVDGTTIEIRRGVVWRRVITVPRSRVQHTDVSQGPLERSYGLGTLVIHTAGTDYARVALPGLAHETAGRIRDHLLPDEPGDGV